MGLNRQEAIEKIKDWAVRLEATDPGAKGFDEAIEPLVIPVMNERLDYDIETGSFTLKLMKPLVGEKTKVEVITLHELTLSDQKVIQRYKDAEGVDKAEALIAKAADIALGDAAKLGSRDLNAASAVLTVFFS
jgi:hypothetical protein